MKIEEIQPKSILVASKLPDADYVINPYTGCQFGCLYCYATFMGRFVNEPRHNWGQYVYVKANAVEVLRSQLDRWPEARCQSTIFLSSVTDPYQGIEHRYRLTRGILETLHEYRYPGKISILTKSPLVLRDVDLFAGLNIDVGITLTTTDDRLGRFLEVAAPSASRRLDTLRKLVEAGIPTYAFIGPLLPHFRYAPELLDDLFASIAAAGVREIYIEHINLTRRVRERLDAELSEQPEAIRQVYRQANTRQHRQALDPIIDELTARYGLHTRLGGAIYHHDLNST